MEFVIIGQSVVDIMETDDGKSIKPGGIYYSVLGMSQIGKFVENIRLITNYSMKNKDMFSSAFNNANLELSTKVKKIPIVELRIWNNKEREETYSNTTQRLSIPLEVSFRKAHGILVNMISGIDLKIGVFETLRKYYFGFVYLDIHSLARGFDENKRRVFRKIPSIKRWLDCADIVQCNENELLTLCDSTNEQEIVNFVFRRRPRIFIVTKGKRGATLYTDLADREKERFDVVPIKVNAKNSVGCGDVFGATFIYYYTESLNVELSFRYANIAAGLFTQYSTIEEFQKLGEDFHKYQNFPKNFS